MTTTTTLDALDDAALMLRVRDGDDDAFSRLVSRYQGRLVRYVSRLARNEETARELVQDTFMKVHGNADRFKPTGSFGSWLFRIAHNATISHLRRRQLPIAERYTGSPDPLDAEIASPAHDPETLARSEEIGRHVRRSLDDLPAKLREAFVLFDVDQHSIAEVSAITGSPEGTIKARVFRARRALRKTLAEHRPS